MEIIIIRSAMHLDVLKYITYAACYTSKYWTGEAKFYCNLLCGSPWVVLMCIQSDEETPVISSLNSFSSILP